jgi:hypothetical protein
LAVVLDVFSRKMVSWQMADTMTTDLVLSALEMGLWRRDVVRNRLVHHSDRGSAADSNGRRNTLIRRCWSGMSAKLGHSGDGKAGDTVAWGGHRWRIVSISCGFGNRSLVGRPVRMLGSEPACHRRLERDGSVRLAGCLQAAPTTPGRTSITGWSGSGKQGRKVYERNQCSNAS